MRDKIIVDKMLRYASKVCKYCQDTSYEEFQANDMLLEACVFNLSQIGELTAKLNDNFKKQYPQVPWAQIYGLRNRIVHDYEGVNLRLIWEIISEDMPDLQRTLNDINDE
ncbi:HepT-like ribonuclease domain-containing protein [Selenomonas sp.]|uniref:HepT-like ribonuclease domain-containing protein n=1 Tax=Selenomonas sp. TaxID=2053611 RepID=UPI003FA1F912